MIRTAVYCSSAMRHFGNLVGRVLDVPVYIESPVGDVETVYIIGMYDPPGYGYTLENTKRAKRRVIHWCGSDVQYLYDYMALPEAVHLCETEQLREELLEKGVYASVVTFPTSYHFEPTPVPENKIAAFYGGSQPDKYGAAMIRALEDCLPEWTFHTYSLGQYNEEGMKALINQSTVYLRFTRHDGSMNSAREFLEAGRPVIVSAPLRGAIQVKHDDLVKVVREMKRLGKSPEVSAEITDYYKTFNSDERYVSELKKAGVISE